MRLEEDDIPLLVLPTVLTDVNQSDVDIIETFLSCLLKKCDASNVRDLVNNPEAVDSLVERSMSMSDLDYLVNHASAISSVWNTSNIMKEALSGPGKADFVKSIHLLSYITRSKGDDRCCDHTIRLNMKISMQAALCLLVTILIGVLGMSDNGKSHLPALFGLFIGLFGISILSSLCISGRYFHYKMNSLFIFTPNQALEMYQDINNKFPILEEYFNACPEREIALLNHSL